MKLSTPLAKKLGLKYPFVSAPMFIISNKEMIVASAEAGILGCMPSLNARTPEKLREDPAMVAAIEAKTPLGRFAEPHEISPGILYLASSASAMVTGHTLAIDGGWLAV